MPAKPSSYRIVGDVAIVALTKGYETLIDAADVDFVCRVSWKADAKTRKDGTVASVYVKRNSSGKCIQLHRALLSAPAGVEVDHINGNGLDNRRGNLRLATRSENARNQGKRVSNTSGFPGVSFHKATNRWRAYICLNRKHISLGYFDSKESAADAYQKAKLSVFGSFARQEGLS